jgi:hypothetical protein
MMSWRISASIARVDLRIRLQDRFLIIFLFGIPILLMVLMRPTLNSVLSTLRGPGASGAAWVVPGISVTWALFIINYVGIGFFEEHRQGTWERPRASWAAPPCSWWP